MIPASTDTTTTSPPSTPIHAQFATSSLYPTTAPARHVPVVVPALPRSPRSPRSTPAAVPFPAVPVQPHQAQSPTPTKDLPPAPRMPEGPSLAPDPEPALQDGPLFRAHVALLERRAHSLRHSLKKLGKALDTSLIALRDSLDAHAHVDETLDDLGGGGRGAGEDPLGDVYERTIRAARRRKRAKIEREVERSRELGDRLKSSVERLKLVDERKKEFESDSKRFYEDLAKYLSKHEPDASKLASSDQKQAERTELFRQGRIEYFSFVEGIVASEEHAVAAWLLAWENISEEEEDTSRDVGETSREGWVHLDEGRAETTTSQVKLLDALHLDNEPASPSLEITTTPSSGSRPTASRSSTLDLPPPLSPLPSSEGQKDLRRKRRTSLPQWSLSPSPSAGADKDSATGGRRDRLKGFINRSLTTAQQSLQSALPSSNSSTSIFSPTSDAFPTSPTATTAPRTPPMPPNDFLRTPQANTAASAPSRRKEGFLYATEVGQKHSSAGDGGARYNRYWVVLSEGQLVEYDRWSDALSVHGTPINLRYATARISKQAGERRFCFEVLTPQLRRVYQATNEIECTEWVAAISKSVESLLNGTSSVRHFDPSRLNGSVPWSNDSASPLSLAMDGKPASQDSFPTSPKGRFAPFLSRHTSLGHARKISGSAKKDKRRSVQQVQNIPSFRIGEEGSPRSDRTFFDSNSRREVFAFSEGTDVRAGLPSRPTLDGLGIPFPGASRSPHPASRSSPNLAVPRSRTATSPSEGFSTGDEGDLDDNGSVVSEQDLAISEAVKRWASGGAPKSPHEADNKFRNAAKIIEIAEDEALGNGLCADCRAADPKWASWSLGIVLCIRCSGIHRSLGTHISKVRSIELDDWTDEQVSAMISVGNTRSNSFFEAEMPLGTVETLEDSSIGNFVKQKYVEKRWVSLVAPTPPPAAMSFASRQSTVP
ncbi:hypothetical protein JCM11491_005370 [Sporobolomyces phaffii]